MPQNNNLEPIELPMDLKFGEPANTKFQNNLKALDVELVDSPTTEQARNVAWHYVKATWADTPYEVDPSTASDAVKSKNLLDVLQFRALPTPMECLGFTFKLSGLSFAYHDRTEAGQLLARAMQDVDRIRFLDGRATMRLLESAIMLVVTVIVLISMNTRLALLSLLSLPLLLIEVYMYLLTLHLVDCPQAIIHLRFRFLHYSLT